MRPLEPLLLGETRSEYLDRLERAEARPAMTDREKLYRNALMWAFDRLGVDGGMTEKEQLRTMREIGNVLCGKRSPAAAYEPNDWDSSAKLPVQGGGE